MSQTSRDPVVNRDRGLIERSDATGRYRNVPGDQTGTYGILCRDTFTRPAFALSAPGRNMCASDKVRWCQDNLPVPGERCTRITTP